MIDRRTFLECAALAIFVPPLLAEARPRPAGRNPRVGVLGEVNPVPWTVRTSVVDVECRWAEGRHDRLPALAGELVERGVDVIVAAGPLATRAARRVTGTIPIVFVAGGDPVREGLVASLARPGGNVTGLSVPSEAELARRRLAALAQVLPRPDRVAVLWSPDNPCSEHVLSRLPGSIAGRGVELRSFAARSVEEIEQAFDAMRAERAGGLLALPDALFAIHGGRLVELAARGRLPAVYGARSFVEAGGLLAVHGDTAEVIRRVAGLVARVLAGELPATLPVQALARSELVVNLETARVLGLRLPRALVASAAAVIGA